MNSLTRQKNIWNAEWKRAMAHIVWCESCGVPDGFGDQKLTQMHATKQRFITTREECHRAAKVCWGEHKSFDEGTGDNVHQRMADFVDALIAKRTFKTEATVISAAVERSQKSTGDGIMKEEIDGYRRTSVKTRDKQKLLQKVEEFEERGEKTMVKEVAGIYYLYVRKEKDLTVAV